MHPQTIRARSAGPTSCPPVPRNPVKPLRGRLPTKHEDPVAKPFFRLGEEILQHERPNMVRWHQRRGQVMWAILNLLYREYCRIRLDEMRKVRLHGQQVMP